MLSRTLLTGSALIIVSLVAAACGPASEADAGCQHTIGLLTAVGKLNDGGLNQAVWDGVGAGAQAIGVSEACYTFIEAVDSTEYLANIEAFVAEGFDIIVTSGVELDGVTRRAGNAHPDVYFIGVEQSQPDRMENVTGILFREDVSGFLAGALAGLMTETGVVGGVFGCETIPPTIRYAVGYRNGARYVNPSVEVRYAYHPGTPDVCAFDADFGAEQASALVEQGVDVIFGAAGGQTANGALLAGCEAGVMVVGAYFDQFSSLPEPQSCLISSVMHKYVDSVRELIVAAEKGTFPGGQVYGQLALAPSYDEAVLPPSASERLDELTRLLAAGQIDACAAPNDGAQCPPLP